MPSFGSLPYRPCVGATIFNRDRHVFVGRRKGGPEHVDITHVWQMPQGGIDDGEDPDQAVLREIYEETSIRNLKKRDEIADWLSYDLPPKVANEAWNGKYRGQTQKWFAFDFTGDDSEINILSPGGGKHKPEFVEWRWEPLKNLPGLIIQFKRAVYDRVVQDFAHLVKD